MKKGGKKKKKGRKGRDLWVRKTRLLVLFEECNGAADDKEVALTSTQGFDASLLNLKIGKNQSPYLKALSHANLYTVNSNSVYIPFF